ncbi:hypothetical protein C5O27_11865 [Gordonia alkanivorans]|nr:hypothetical protein C5O27_11865 [Gordonia alkanivorans]
MSAYNAGVRAAREELAERAATSGDDEQHVAEQMLATMTLRDDDDFEQGYRDKLADVLNRWCKHCRRVFDVPNYWRTCPECLPIEYADGEGYTILDDHRIFEMVDGYFIHTLIGSEGGELLYVVDGDDKNAPCKGLPVPDHERLGKLPAKYTIKVLRAKCGRMTRSGKPCRNGPWCRVHRSPSQGHP